MGPEASSHLYKLLIKFSISHFGAKNNDDFPEILLFSIPIPAFLSDKKLKSKVLKMLTERTRSANKMDLGFLTLACNTVHVFIDDLRRISKVPLISMIDEVVSKIDKDNLKKVGILGTHTTLKSKLYQKALDKFGVKYVEPNDLQMKIIEKIIKAVIAGSSCRNDQKILVSIADDLRRKGAGGIVLGCTELPLIFPKKYNLPAYNSLEILAMASLQKYYKQNTI